VVLHGDGGGKAPATARAIHGRARVARTLIAGLGTATRTGGFTVRREEVNCQPGAVFFDPEGRVGGVMVLDVADARDRRRRNSDVAGAVEPFMNTGHTISIAPTRSHVEVRLGGRLLATTDRAMKLDETGLPTRYYLPRDDVQMDLLRPTTFHTTCPFKGEASYWSLDIDGEVHDGIVWSYETPTDQAAEVTGMLSFYPDRTEVTVDGQSLPG
jgi:uncharacterized protein (DUF427 family)